MDPTQIAVVSVAALVALFISLFFFGPRGRTRAAAADGLQTVELTVDNGYRPDRIVVKAAVPVRLQALRADRSPCSEQLVLPDLGITRHLPTGKVVTIDLPALRPGQYEFTCGMNMLRGRLMVEA
jgi:plastocyanin domain-containing protein